MYENGMAPWWYLRLFHSLNRANLGYPEHDLDGLHVEIQVVFEESDANVAEVAAALAVNHVYNVLKW